MSGQAGRDLTAVQRLHYVLHNVLSRVGMLPGHGPVQLERRPEGFVVVSEGQTIHIPAALRWRMYRKGWARRSARLARQFGVPDLVPLKPGDTVIDIGANVGEFALACAARGADVHCVEGDPAVYACLSRNTEAELRIRRYNNVLWSAEEDITFFSAPERADSSVFAAEGDPSYTAMTVRATTLDRLAEDAGIGAVTLLKCDAEGAEPEVMAGAHHVLARTRTVAVDTGPERLGAETHDAVAEILRESGFVVRREIRDGRKMTVGVRRG